ncbi:MAG: ABC transporter ATP-binding protein [Deltaproteobacteria bacterium]|nr:ABC transporter ATP-binding protein [Deltaproteobacteria bacterium]
METRLLQVEHVELSGVGAASFSFVVESSESVGLVGPNGAGKTTLLRAILGEPLIDSGRVVLGGTDVIALAITDLPQWVSYMPQEAVYPSNVRVGDYLSLALLARSGDLNLAQAAERFEVTPFLTRRLGRLSSGERQRVHLARVFLQRARLLLLDEPTNHLDPGAKTRFWDILARERQANGCSALVVTHDLELAKKSCDKILAMNAAGILYWGAASGLSESIVAQLFDQ